MDFLINIDSDIFLFLNGLMRTPFLDSFMHDFSERYVWVAFYAALLYAVARSYSWKGLLLIVLGVTVAITVSDQTCATIIRPFVGRLRPSHLENPLSEFTRIVGTYRGGRYGFPSCHAANSFALAVLMSLLLRRGVFAAAMLLWATINSLSRIYLGVHYPGDLIVGAIVGTAVAFIVYGALHYGGVRPRRLNADDAAVAISILASTTFAMTLVALIQMP